MKLKTHILIVARLFPKTHPKAGEATCFKESIREGWKIHTIRSNYSYWKEIERQIKAREAFLSIREWKGQPYRSKQRELLRVDTDRWNEHCCGVQRIHMPAKTLKSGYDIVISGTRYPIKTIAENDGLFEKDFRDWFKETITNGAIIHFTQFRY